MRRLGDGGIVGSARQRLRKSGVALIVALYVVQGLEHGNMYDRHGGAGACRSVLLAKHPGLSRCQRSVVQAGSVERNFIPAMDRIEPWFGLNGLGHVELWVIAGAQCFAVSSRKTLLCPGESGETYDHRDQNQNGPVVNDLVVPAYDC